MRVKRGCARLRSHPNAKEMASASFERVLLLDSDAGPRNPVEFYPRTGNRGACFEAVMEVRHCAEGEADGRNAGCGRGQADRAQKILYSRQEGIGAALAG